MPHDDSKRSTSPPPTGCASPTSSERAVERTVAYVEHNPVAAGLVAESGDWGLSSAAVRRRSSGEA